MKLIVGAFCWVMKNPFKLEIQEVTETISFMILKRVFEKWENNTILYIQAFFQALFYHH